MTKHVRLKCHILGSLIKKRRRQRERYKKVGVIEKKEPIALHMRHVFLCPFLCRSLQKAT